MARMISDKFNAEVTVRRGPTEKEVKAIEAIHRAVEFNPHVPAYLLEQKRYFSALRPIKPNFRKIQLKTIISYDGNFK